MSRHTYLDGIALANFRGIGKDAQRVGPFSQFNFFIGPNNAGKSSVIDYISRYLPYVSAHRKNTENQSPVRDLDVNVDAIARSSVRLGYGILKSHLREKVSGALEQKGQFNSAQTSKILKALDAFLNAMVLDASGLIWFERSQGDGKKIHLGAGINEIAEALQGQEHSVQLLWSVLLGKQGGSLALHWIPELVEYIISIPHQYPGCAIIPAIREISEKGQNFEDWSGKGLIEEQIGRAHV